MIGTLFAFLSSIIYALGNIIMRKLKNTPAAVTITWFSICSFIFALLGIVIAKIFLPEENTQTIRVINFEYEFLILILNSVCGVFAQLFITIALKVEEAGTISLARSVDILFAFIFQSVFLSEPIYGTSLCGAAIISVGVTLSSLNKIREKRNQTNKAASDSNMIKNNESTASCLDLSKPLDFKLFDNKIIDKKTLDIESNRF